MTFGNLEYYLVLYVHIHITSKNIDACKLQSEMCHVTHFSPRLTLEMTSQATYFVVTKNKLMEGVRLIKEMVKNWYDSARKYTSYLRKTDGVACTPTLARPLATLARVNPHQWRRAYTTSHDFFLRWMPNHWRIVNIFFTSYRASFQQLLVIYLWEDYIRRRSYYVITGTTSYQISAKSWDNVTWVVRLTRMAIVDLIWVKVWLVVIVGIVF